MKEQARQLAILPTATLDDPTSFRYFPIERADGQPADEVSSVFWHPSGEFLAVGMSAREIQFFRFGQDSAGNLSLMPHGNRITGGSTFSYGQFTQDGRFYLVSDINWDRFPPPLRNLINPPSEMMANPLRRERHGRARDCVARPGGLERRPQEDLLVTVDMERTYLPDSLGFWPGAQLNSLCTAWTGWGYD